MNKTTIPHLDKIIAIGKSICPEFSIEGQENYYTQLSDYFFTEQKKGLFICGSVGIGKTLSMEIFRKLLFELGKDNFAIVYSRHLVRDFIENGVKIIDKYGRNSFSMNSHGLASREKPLTVCFDDIGLEETNAKLFGNQSNVLAEILLDRYENFISYGMKTICTTNIAPDKIKEIYGERLADRLIEMMKIITITGKSKRK